jgi:hypothetical protein
LRMSLLVHISYIQSRTACYQPCWTSFADSGRRWYHQSQVKNGMLFVHGGIESFSDRSAVQYVCIFLIFSLFAPILAHFET